MKLKAIQICTKGQWRLSPNPRSLFSPQSAFISMKVTIFGAAAMVEQGIKLAGSQPGGHYGSNLISTKEDHEIACSDRFFS